MLRLSSSNVSPYDFFSQGTGINPATVAVTLTGAGGNINSNATTVYLVATEFMYTTINMAFRNVIAGIEWQMSINGNDWLHSLFIDTMDAKSGDVITPIYLRNVVSNDGSVNTGNYNTPQIEILAVENP